MNSAPKRPRAERGAPRHAGRSFVVVAASAFLVAGVAGVAGVGGSACGRASLEVLRPIVDEPDAGGSDGVAPDTDASIARPDGGTQADYCSGVGPPTLVVRREAGAVPLCPGALAQSAFRYAMCMCAGLNSNAPLTTDSFNSALGPYDPLSARAGGGVGANGNVSALGGASVGGAFWASDVTGATVGRATIAGELHVAGRLASGALLDIGGDAFALGDIAASGDLTVRGTLHQPPGATTTVGGARNVAATQVGSFTVPAACDCDPALFVDVAGFTESFRADNDDAASKLDPRALENVGQELTFPLPCGRIFFTQIGANAPLHVQLAPGRTAIFIGGDLAAKGALTIEGSDAEVDLFVGGNVLVGGAFTFGSAASPRKARLWVGGNGTVQLTNTSEIAGNIYAPHAELVLGTTTVFGSVFAHRIAAQGELKIHYDEAVLTSADACGAPPLTCTSCHDCGNQACFAGACGACTETSQCCPPLVCAGGKCVASR